MDQGEDRARRRSKFALALTCVVLLIELAGGLAPLPGDALQPPVMS